MLIVEVPSPPFMWEAQRGRDREIESAVGADLAEMPVIGGAMTRVIARFSISRVGRARRSKSGV